jgi:hypothetical protein
MRNRLAWGLAVMLAASLLAGVGGLSAYGRQTGAFTVRWQPVSYWRYWRVGKGEIALAACGPYGSTGTLVGHEYSLGFVEVEVPYRGPNVVLWNTVRRPPQSPGKGTGNY